MERLRSELDAGKQMVPGPSLLPDERNTYEVRCGICGRISYVDESTLRRDAGTTVAAQHCVDTVAFSLR